MTEAWAWGRGDDELVGLRSASPWDDEPRRPSHADKRRAWRRELLAAEIRAVLRPGVTEEEIQDTAETVLSVSQAQSTLSAQFRSSEPAKAALNDLRRAQAEAEVRCF